MNPLAPLIPAEFGPHRRELLEHSQNGWCAVCDDKPIPWVNKQRKGKRFTCGGPVCVHEWGNACTRDKRYALRRRAA